MADEDPDSISYTIHFAVDPGDPDQVRGRHLAREAITGALHFELNHEAGYKPALMDVMPAWEVDHKTAGASTVT